MRSPLEMIGWLADRVSIAVDEGVIIQREADTGVESAVLLGHS